MKKLIFILVCLSQFSCAQKIPRDTSYTIQSAYEKISKKYPHVKIAAPGFPEGIRANEEIPYRALGKRKLLLNAYYPKEDGNYPGVLLIHGGGWRTGDKSLLIPMAQQLAARGYVTVCVEYRLSLEAPFPAAVHDLKTALRWMRANAENYNIDTSKIAVYGTSAGGQLAALIGTTNGHPDMEDMEGFTGFSNNVQAIIDVDGVLAFKHPESEEGTMAAQWLGGTYEEVPENWDKASALTHVNKDTPPVLFISSSFPRFHAGKHDMISILKEHGIYYESYEIPDSPHSFWLLEPWFAPTLDYTSEFLDKVFKNNK